MYIDAPKLATASSGSATAIVGDRASPIEQTPKSTAARPISTATGVAPGRGRDGTEQGAETAHRSERSEEPGPSVERDPGQEWGGDLLVECQCADDGHGDQREAHVGLGSRVAQTLADLALAARRAADLVELLAAHPAHRHHHCEEGHAR